MSKTRAALAVAAASMSLLTVGCSSGDEAVVTACSALESANWEQLEKAAEDLNDLDNEQYEDMESGLSYTAYQALRTTPSNGLTPPEMAEANLVDAFDSAWRECAREIEDFPEMSGPQYETVSEDLLEKAGDAFAGDQL